MAEGDPFKLALSNLSALGGVMIIVGTLIRLTTYRYLGRFFRYEASIQKDHQLIVTGPYSIVRHPSYTGFLISHPGWFLWQLSPGSWVRESGLWDTVAGKIVVLTYAEAIIFGTVYTVLRRMKAEDDALRKVFGERWEQWAKEVPYFVIPGVY
jgi:protein-S-isoprenylcysteine O-methyltransferase Ste14